MKDEKEHQKRAREIVASWPEWKKKWASQMLPGFTPYESTEDDGDDSEEHC